jgi:hypothetical protein
VTEGTEVEETEVEETAGTEITGSTRRNGDERRRTKKKLHSRTIPDVAASAMFQ